MSYGCQKGEAEVCRGYKEVGRLLHKVKVEIALNDKLVDPALEAIG